MKKILLIIFLILLILFSCCFYFYNQNDIKSILKNVKEEFYVDNYSIFGTHMSISGCIDKKIEDDLNLVLKNKNEEIILDSNFYIDEDKTCFYTSENYNNGIYLDDLKIGDFLLLIKQSDEVYYTLKNNTEYENLEYYTITRNNSNNKIEVLFDKYNNKNYIEFKIKKENLPSDIYDITIDPGHGGSDPGTSGKIGNELYYESDITLNVALALKSNLEKLGLKVKMTRDDDSYLSPYGESGRAVIPNSSKSKYSLSIHVNSTVGTMNYGGVEVYTPNNIDLEFANILAKNIAQYVNYSRKQTDRISSGIYYSYFTKQNILDSSNSMLEEGMIPYDIKENAPYMYMIREVGGIHTSAYVDGRNEEYGLNKYYNSNHTAEPYLIELAYINYPSDIDKLVNNPEIFSNAISKSVAEFLKIS